MATVAGNIIRAACRFRFQSIDEIINVHHFTVQDETAPPDDEDMLADLSEVLSDVYAEVQSRITTDVSAEDISVYNVSQDYPCGTINWTSPFVGGTSTGDGLPPGVSEVVLWRTGVKRVLGKTFLPPFAESQQNSGLVVSAALSDMDDFAAAMRAILVGTHGYSFIKGIWSDEAGEMRPIVSAKAAPRIGYQRRRKAGIGS